MKFAKPGLFVLMVLGSAMVVAEPVSQGPAGGQPVGGELYGNNKPTNQPLYGPQSEPLPSEALIATQRSGALPSELRFAYDAVGPLAASGAASYIPAQSALQRAMGATPPNLWGPAWFTPQEAPKTGTPAPIPQPGAPTTPLNRAVNVSPQIIQPQVVQSGYRLSADPRTFNNLEGTTTIHYYRKIPSTQPAATQPSLSNRAK